MHLDDIPYILSWTISIVCGIPGLTVAYAWLDTWRRNAFKRSHAPIFVRYNIPFLGNALEFGTDMAGFIERNRHELGNVPIFSSLINGKIMHIVTDPAAIPQIYRTKQLTFRPTLAEFVGLGFGCSNELLDKVFLGEKNRFQDFKMTLMKYLLSSGELNNITADAQRVLRERIHSYSSSEWQSYDLMEMVCDWIFKASVSACISPTLAFNENLKNLEIFDSLCPLVFAGIPMKYIPPGYKARESLYSEINSSEFTKSKCRLLQGECKFLESLGASDEDIKRLNLFLLWAAVANSMPAVFWMVYYLLSQEGAWEAMRDEVQSIYAQKEDKSTPFTSEELDRMVGLQSAFTETLRMASSLRVLRDVAENFEFDLKLSNTNNGDDDDNNLNNKYFVQKGSVVVGFTPQLHKDENVFGANANVFQWDRFLPADSGEPVKFYNKKTGKLVNDAMRAFGGGAHLCPGRKFIANEVKALVATLVTRCELKLVVTTTTDEEEVGFDVWRQGAGIPQPDKPVQVQIRRLKGL